MNYFLTRATKGLLIGLVAMLSLSSCVSYVGPGPGPRGYRVGGHYDRAGYWIPAHPGGPANRDIWAAGHYNRNGAWIPGHYRR